MGHENSAMKSWLPQAGTIKRTIILKKLKRSLERRGLTREEVYNGLLQLATTPRVLVARWRIRDYCQKQSHVEYDVAERQKLSSLTEIEEEEEEEEEEENRSRSDKLREARDQTIDEIEDNDDASMSTTPELLDEKVGKECTFLVKIPRKAITLNLNTYRLQGIEDAAIEQTGAPSTEIRIADSSIAEEEMSSSGRYSPGTQRIRGRDDNACSAMSTVTKKPKIVEDVTCVEGTIIARTSLINLSRASAKNSGDMDKVDGTKIEGSTSFVRSENCIASKRRTRIVTCGRKKLRLRRKFRQFFGHDLTLSELDEEDGIVERFVRERRKKNMRNSSDSGVGLSEINSDGKLVRSSRVVNRLEFSDSDESLDERTSATEKPVNSNDKIDAPSMPLLDAQTLLHDANLSPGTLAVAALPDSSTSSEVNPMSREDNSICERIEISAKQTTIVSPANVESTDSFPSVNIEINVPCETQVSTPTSTTGYFPAVKSSSPIEEPERAAKTDRDQELGKLLEMDVFGENCDITLRGNTISIRESSECVVPSKDPTMGNESVLIDNSANSEISNEMLPNERTETNDDESLESTDCAGKRTKELNNEEKFVDSSMANGQESENAANEANEAKDCANAVASLKLPSIPKFRVLHHSELGSRWCPTPLENSDTNESIVSPISTAENLSRDSETSDQSPRPSSLGHQDSSFGSNIRFFQGQSNETIPTTGRSDSSQQSVNCSSRLVASVPISINNTANSMLGSIFSLLLSLDWCIQRSKSTFPRYDPASIQREYSAKKPLLWRELREFSLAIGSIHLSDVVNYIVSYYETIMPLEHRVLNRQKVIDVLRLDELYHSQLSVAEHQIRRHQRYYASASRSTLRPPPPQYPTASPSCSVTNLPPYHPPPPRSFLPINRDQPAKSSERSSRRGSNVQPCDVATAPAIFSPVQLAILTNQIAWYRYFLKILPQQTTACSRPRERSKNKRSKSNKVAAGVTENTIARTVENSASNEANEILPPTLLEETIVRVYHEQSDIVVHPAGSVAPVHQPENVPRFEERDEPANKDTSGSVCVADVLEELASLSSSRSNDAKGPNDEASKSSSPDGSSIIPGSNERIESISLNSLESTTRHCNDKTEIEEIDESRTRSIIDDEYNNSNNNNNNNDNSNDDDEKEKNEKQKVASTESLVPVITLDECDDYSTEIIARDEIPPNFSILDVKSISKDVFNNMGKSSDDATREAINVEESSPAVVKFESKKCLRCGQPSFIVCEQCCEAFYCSFECHEVHWAAHHHLTCKPVPAEDRAGFESSDPSPKNNLTPPKDEPANE